MAEAFIGGILTIIGVALIVLSQVLLYKCGEANYSEVGDFASGYSMTLILGLGLLVGGIGSYITNL